MKIKKMLLVSFLFYAPLIAMQPQQKQKQISNYYQNVEDYFHGLPGSSKNASKTTKICIIITECDQKLKESKKKKPGS